MELARSPADGSGSELTRKALRHLISAGDRALRLHPAKAAASYARALDLASAGGEQGAEVVPQRLELLMKIAWSSALSGDRPVATAAIFEAERKFRETRRKGEAGWALAIRGRLHFLSGETKAAKEALAEAVQLLRSEGSPAQFLQAIICVSAVNVTTGEVDEGSRLATDALQVAADAGEEAARASLLASLGAMEVLAGNEHGLDRIRAALELSGSLGESEPLSRGYVNLVISLREMGSSEEGVKACRRGSEVMTRMGGLGLERVVAALEACMAVERGDLEAGARRAREVLDPGRTSKPVPVLLFAAHALAAALMRQGESRPDARRAR